jgi:hypothetical protein
VVVVDLADEAGVGVVEEELNSVDGEVGVAVHEAVVEDQEVPVVAAVVEEVEEAQTGVAGEADPKVVPKLF